MKTPAANAFERLIEERRQVEALFHLYARCRAEPDFGVAGAVRLSTLIFTLLRLHDDLESAVLQQSLIGIRGAYPLLVKVAGRRQAVLDAVEQAEAFDVSTRSMPTKWRR